LRAALQQQKGAHGQRKRSVASILFGRAWGERGGQKKRKN